jgi:D-arabinose 1-dehydrogenase-like Zn-dependent alcohol dehydrogenase
VKSYDIVAWGQPLQAVLRDTPVPRGGEVLVKVQACGVCHSDLHIQAGHLDLGNGRKVSFESVGLRLPFTLGHEIVGTVAAAGPDATATVGAPCVVYPWIGCGHCRQCLRGDELACEANISLGTRRAGGFADHVLVPHARYLLDYGTLDPLVAATCACSGLTAYSALRKLPPLAADDGVLLIGAGGLGLAALGLATALTPARIVVGDIDTGKLALARSSGARDTIDLGGDDAAGRLRALLGEGARGVIDFVGSPDTVDLAMKAAGKGGTVIVVGLYGGALPLSTALLPMRNLTLRGSYVGSLQEMRELLALAQREPVLRVPILPRPMAQLNDALAELESGRAHGRIVALADA